MTHPIEDVSQFSHNVACFMVDMFKHQVAQYVHGNSIPPPEPPEGMPAILHSGCQHAVTVCLQAFVNPSTHISGIICGFPLFIIWVVGIDVDFKQYCNDCSTRHLGGGMNSKKEHILKQSWHPQNGHIMRISSPHTVVDTKGVIISWALHGALIPELQVRCILYAVRI